MFLKLSQVVANLQGFVKEEGRKSAKGQNRASDHGKSFFVGLIWKGIGRGDRSSENKTDFSKFICGFLFAVIDLLS